MGIVKEPVRLEPIERNTPSTMTWSDGHEVAFAEMLNSSAAGRLTPQLCRRAAPSMGVTVLSGIIGQGRHGVVATNGLSNRHRGGEGQWK
jgi:hypothetical protein